MNENLSIFQNCKFMFIINLAAHGLHVKMMFDSHGVPKLTLTLLALHGRFFPMDTFISVWPVTLEHLSNIRRFLTESTSSQKARCYALFQEIVLHTVV